MKKVTLLFSTLIFLIAISSCTPEAGPDHTQPNSCCGDDGNLPPITLNGGGN